MKTKAGYIEYLKWRRNRLRDSVSQAWINGEYVKHNDKRVVEVRAIGRLIKSSREND